MELVVKIKDKTYSGNTVQGVTFTEEYNETLDSGSIIISQVPKIEDLNPYDDVYIYSENLSWNGYPNRCRAFYDLNHYRFKYRTDKFVPPGTTTKYFILYADAIMFINAYGNNAIYPRAALANVEFYIKNNNGDLIKYKFTVTGISGAIRPGEIIPYTYTIYMDITNTITNSTFSITGSGNDSSKEIMFGFINDPYLNQITDFTGVSGDLNFVPSADIVNYTSTNPDPSWVTTESGFYRHMLVDRFSEDIVNIEEGVYKYKIQLFSETKRLEKVQLPNISVTEPLNKQLKKTTAQYMQEFVELYSPKYKIQTNRTGENGWVYVNKYSIAPQTLEFFNKVYPQDFSLTAPALKDVLSQLMVSQDRIPYVKDDVIFDRDITARITPTETLDQQKQRGEIGLINGNKSSDDYCDGVRRQYSNGLPQEGLCTYTERLGFRAPNQALMTFENMHVQTNHPIYNINKMYMCYYKKVQLVKNGTTSDYVFLCKQDITKLVKYDSEWNVLEQDWRELGRGVQTINELARYKLSTVYYSQGGNTISGWGQKYSYEQSVSILFGVFRNQKSFLQNMFIFMEQHYPYGIYSKEEVMKMGGDDVTNIIITNPVYGSGVENFYPFLNVYVGENGVPGGKIEGITNNEAVLPAKLITFEINYVGFFNGALIHSRDKGIDNIYSTDNSSTALSIMGKDGLSQKEKLNRFANKTHLIPARYDTINKMFPLGSVHQIGSDNDVIIYRREYSIYDNFVKVNYAGVQDYVLKNYFTSVFAKLRTYQLMSFGESVLRSENVKVYLTFSRDKYVCEWIPYFKFDSDTDLMQKLLSAFTDSKIYSSYNVRNKPETINQGYFITKDGKKYLADVNVFTSGTSLVFNIAMSNNVTAGTYISEFKTDAKILFNFSINEEVEKEYIGSTQKQYYVVDSEETGFIKELTFVFSHVDFVDDTLMESKATFNVNERYTNSLFLLPQKQNNDLLTINEKNIIKINKQFNKDNKDRIDMTFQIEPVSKDSGLFLSAWLFKLNDLLDYYYKNDSHLELEKVFKDAIIIRQDATTNYLVFNNGIWTTTGYSIIESTFKNKMNQTIRESADPSISSLDSMQYGDIVIIDFKFYNSPYLSIQLRRNSITYIIANYPLTVGEESIVWGIALSTGAVVGDSLSINIINGDYYYVKTLAPSGQTGNFTIITNELVATQYPNIELSITDENLKQLRIGAFVNFEVSFSAGSSLGAFLEWSVVGFIFKASNILYTDNSKNIAFSGKFTTIYYDRLFRARKTVSNQVGTLYFYKPNGSNTFVNHLDYTNIPLPTDIYGGLKWAETDEGPSEDKHRHWQGFSNLSIDGGDHIVFDVSGGSSSVTPNPVPFPIYGAVNSAKIYSNMKIVLSNNKIDKTIIYQEYLKRPIGDTSTNPHYLDPTDLSVANMFKVTSENYIPCITVDLAYIPSSMWDTINSIQYWYFNDNNAYFDNSRWDYDSTTQTYIFHQDYQYNENQSSYAFVFGINLTDEDKELMRSQAVDKKIKIYTSITENRDTRVYDTNHHVIGEVSNALEEEDYNEEQKYTENT